MVSVSAKLAVSGLRSSSLVQQVRKTGEFYLLVPACSYQRSAEVTASGLLQPGDTNWMSSSSSRGT